MATLMLSSGRMVTFPLHFLLSSGLTFQADLNKRTGIGRPVQDGLFQTVQFWLSFLGCPATVFLSMLYCTVRILLSLLSCPSLPIFVVLSQLSFCHILGVLSLHFCHGWPAQAELSCRPVISDFSRLSSPYYPAPVVTSWLSGRSCPVKALSCLPAKFWPYCFLGPVQAYLSSRPVQTDLSGCLVPDVLSRLSCNGCQVSVTLSQLSCPVMLRVFWSLFLVMAVLRWSSSRVSLPAVVRLSYLSTLAPQLSEELLFVMGSSF
jgi:hypothetical protein